MYAVTLGIHTYIIARGNSYCSRNYFFIILGGIGDKLLLVRSAMPLSTSVIISEVCYVVTPLTGDTVCYIGDL